MTQPSLFESPLSVRCPRWLCAWAVHRHGLAEAGPPQDRGTCVNTDWRCLTCGATGESSEKKAGGAT